MSSPVNLEWENQNALRNYPFRESGRLSVSSLGVQLPVDAVLDLFVFVTPSGDERYYLASLEILQDLSVIFHFAGVTSGLTVAQVVVPREALPQASFEVTGTGWGTTGKLVIGPGMQEVRRWGFGNFPFLAAESELESTVMIPLDLGVVTSVGIDLAPEVLIRDVKLEFGRAIQGETSTDDNSLIIDAIKFIEDCEKEREGCPLQMINGVKPDDYGNVVLTTEGIFSWDAKENGLIISGIWGIHDCPVVFTPALRGSDGAAGPAGPAGPGGLNRLCGGGICCECEVCDTCEQWDLALSVPRVIGSSAKSVAVPEGTQIEITGSDFVYERTKPDNTVFRREFVSGVIWCGENAVTFETFLLPPVTSTSVQAIVPPGLTSPPSPGNQYSIRLATPWGWTNPTTILVTPAGPTKLESFDAIGPWTGIGPSNIAIEAVNQFEGLGAFEVSSNPFGGPPGGVSNSSGISGLGAPPWNFSIFTSLKVLAVKEFDPGEGAPLDFIDVTLTDNTFATATVSVPVPGPLRFSGPHVVSSGEVLPILFPTAGFGGIDLTQITQIDIKVIDINSSVPLTAWFDCMEGIP